jgi:hypothetical protein
MASDPYFANVALLCHFDGTNGATATVDSSSHARTITRIGSFNTLSTTQAKFGATSTTINPSSGAYWRCADSADFDFGAGQFTVELWLFPTSTPSSGERRLVAQWAAGNFAWFFGFGTSTALRFRYTVDGSTRISLDGAWTPILNAWYHLAVDRDAANVVRIYVDGTVAGSGTVAATLFNSTATLEFAGDDGTALPPPAGFMDDLRITKGVARYGGAFTPPAAPFPDVGYDPAQFMFAA